MSFLVFLMIRLPTLSTLTATLFPSTTLLRFGQCGRLSDGDGLQGRAEPAHDRGRKLAGANIPRGGGKVGARFRPGAGRVACRCQPRAAPGRGRTVPDGQRLAGGTADPSRSGGKAFGDARALGAPRRASRLPPGALAGKAGRMTHRVAILDRSEEHTSELQSLM